MSTGLRVADPKVTVRVCLTITCRMDLSCVCTNITLGYNLTGLSFVKKLGISGLRFYTSIDNAFTITKYLGYNPEVDFNNGANLTPGVDYGKYPLVRSFNAGVKVQF